MDWGEGGIIWNLPYYSVYCLQIPALVPEIFKFEKCVKYANEMTDDVMHSTQYYIMHMLSSSICGTDH